MRQNMVSYEIPQHKLKKNNIKSWSKMYFLYLICSATLEPSQFRENYVAALVFLWTIYLFNSLDFSGILEKPLLGE